ncbi:hypothetical protein CCR75_000829 [Bremia lactucae]|uniref:Uncharacterized protein n=1 Tax=Bremia lactucae TaxID=4779 RepID=A0A976FNR3_BRELC|nr:hypothetical protein CCR75_000829 [Bremia lactucae]
MVLWGLLFSTHSSLTREVRGTKYVKELESLEDNIENLPFRLWYHGGNNENADAICMRMAVIESLCNRPSLPNTAREAHAFLCLPYPVRNRQRIICTADDPGVTITAILYATKKELCHHSGSYSLEDS